MPSNRSEDKCCRKSSFLTFARCFRYIHQTFYTLSSTQRCRLLVLCSQEFFCCTTHLNQFASLQNLTQRLLWKFHHWQHMWIFFVCSLFFSIVSIISVQEIKYPYLHPYLTYIFNLAAICNSIPKNQFDVCGRGFLQTKKEGIQCCNLRIKDLICN